MPVVYTPPALTYNNNPTDISHLEININNINIDIIPALNREKTNIEGELKTENAKTLKDDAKITKIKLSFLDKIYLVSFT